MGATDKVIGSAFVTTAVVVFTYYLLWLLVGSGVVRSVHIGAAVAPRGRLAFPHTQSCHALEQP